MTGEREELFIDGPLAGWRAVPDDWRRSGTMRYPKWRDIDVTSFGQPEPERISLYDYGTYTRHSYVCLSWRVPLAFWAEGIMHWPMPSGTVLPGWVEGQSMPHTFLGDGHYGPALQWGSDWKRLQAAWDELIERPLRCGNAYCDRCGDCLKCFGDDPCYDGGEHSR